MNPSGHVLHHVLGVLPHDLVLLEEWLEEGGGAPLLPDLPDLLQPPLAKPGPHFLGMDAIQVFQVLDGVINLLGKEIKMKAKDSQISFKELDRVL